MGKSRLTYGKIVTFSVEAESIINSRPLNYVDDDPNKLNDKCFTYNKNVADPDELRTLAQKVELSKDYFYKRFEKEYLCCSTPHGKSVVKTNSLNLV